MMFSLFFSMFSTVKITHIVTYCRLFNAMITRIIMPQPITAELLAIVRHLLALDVLLYNCTNQKLFWPAVTILMRKKNLQEFLCEDIV